MSDVLMYFTDTLLRYGVTPEELSAAYVNKHERNIKRNYPGEYSRKYGDEK
ncbi:MAG TPA: dATP/dGTP pyrophosphohydrolase domain-containing protein [Clostridia bacterium]|nr:dATP/dGTP pyrophosphohydrolase domain-containing protein [Clostridia bacterium]